MFKNRHVVRKKEAKSIRETVREVYDCDIPGDPTIERAKLFDVDVIIVDNSVDFLLYDDRILFILTSIDKYKPRKKFVTVDMGAVRFIAGGADVMVPGIVDADVDIKSGDPVWVRDERHGKVIAVGISMMEGKDLIEKDKGRGIKNIHWVGDKIWKTIKKA